MSMALILYLVFGCFVLFLLLVGVMAVVS